MSKAKQRRPPARRYGRVEARGSRMGEVPLLPVIVGGILLVGAIAALVIASLNPTASNAAQPVDGISCQTGEQLAVHYHSHLSILVAGNDAVIPAGVGIDNTSQCLYWMHTHATDGVIHIEAPKAAATRKFTLGNFFDIWRKRLDRTHVGATTLTSSQKLVMHVDGKLYTGDPRAIVLGTHTQVVLEVTPPEAPAPPTFTFPAGE